MGSPLWWLETENQQINTFSGGNKSYRENNEGRGGARDGAHRNFLW